MAVIDTGEKSEKTEGKGKKKPQKKILDQADELQL